MSELETWPPEQFWQRMESVLDGDEFAAFRTAMLEERPFVGLRTNTLKLTPQQLATLLPFELTSLGSHLPAGFWLARDTEEKPGRYPLHAAGLYYLQEPSAMTVAALVDPQPGEWVIDLAAAPGGKATHLAALMGGEGLLVANDVNRPRAGILAQNLERWGATQVAITAAPVERLAEQWAGLFDRVLLDAPCSGEGMFRKQGPFEWSESLVEMCARRQTAVLPDAAKLVRPGGRLVYSTCTFAPAENEQVIAAFLETHPDFHLVPAKPLPGAENGRSEWANGNPALQHTVRLWPHRFLGEGHFIAVLERRDSPERLWPVDEPSSFSVPTPAQLRLWHEFRAAYLQGAWADDRLLFHNGRLFYRPDTLPALDGIPIVRLGVELGELRKGYFRPAHGLALTLTAETAVLVHDLEPEADELTAYLRGEVLRSPGEDGWVLVCVAGFGLGWGKRVNGRLKNHYPRGLRHFS